MSTSIAQPASARHSRPHSMSMAPMGGVLGRPITPETAGGSGLARDSPTTGVGCQVARPAVHHLYVRPLANCEPSLQCVRPPPHPGRQPVTLCPPGDAHSTRWAVLPQSGQPVPVEVALWPPTSCSPSPSARPGHPKASSSRRLSPVQLKFQAFGKLAVQLLQQGCVSAQERQILCTR